MEGDGGVFIIETNEHAGEWVDANSILQIFKASPNTTKIRLLFLSANYHEPTVQNFIEAGF